MQGQRAAAAALAFLHHHSSPQQDCIREEYVIFINLISHGNFTCLTPTVWEELFSDVKRGDRGGRAMKKNFIFS